MSASTRVLFVCSANVCRSPLALDVFERGLRSAGANAPVQLDSAGIAARPGEARCPWSAKTGAGTSVASDGARAVDFASLAASTMILAADRSVRSALVRSFPSERERVFTVKEAAALGRLVVEGDRAGRGLDWLVNEMDARRGWLPMDRQPARRPVRRPPRWSKVFDVPDAHSEDGTRHSVMFAELEPAVRRCSDVVAEVCSVSQPAST